MPPIINPAHPNDIPDANPMLTLLQELLGIVVITVAILFTATFLLFVCVDAWRATRGHDPAVKSMTTPRGGMTRVLVDDKRLPVYERCTNGWCTQSPHPEDLEASDRDTLR